MSEPIRFFLPGPTWVPEDARQAMSRPPIGHRSAAFKEIWQRVASRLPAVARTSGDVMIATGSSTLIMESAVISCLRPEQEILHLVCGEFSERWYSISRSLGRRAARLDAAPGTALDPDAVRAALRQAGGRYAAVALVHNETSTGVMNPLREIAQVVRQESDAIILVDTVSSLAGAPVETDEWGLDVVLAGVQKALALPPGIALFTLSDRAAARAAANPHRGFYSDLLRYRDKHREGGAITTPAISIIYALDVQLERILAEGMEARWARHRRLLDKTVHWASARGLEYPAAPEARSWTVSCIKPPSGVAAPDVVKAAAKQGYTIGGGYGPWKATTFRIGHMGEVSEADLDALLAVLDGVIAV